MQICSKWGQYLENLGADDRLSNYVNAGKRTSLHYDGLQAVGVASNKKARRRAARLAPVVAAHVQSGRSSRNSAENPELSGLVAEAVHVLGGDAGPTNFAFVGTGSRPLRWPKHISRINPT